MPWIKHGRIFNPAEHAWAGTHAQVPTALAKERVIRIYYSDRFADGRSFTTYLDVDRSEPTKVVYMHREPILPFGAPGTFDDDGLMANCAIHHGDQVYLYYSGWNRGVTVPYRNATGLAVSEDGGDTFRRMFEGPILERNALEPHLAVTPCVMKDGAEWRMWYVSGLRWERVDGKFEPVYVIKYARSVDGLRWERPNIACFEQSHPLEAHSCPSVVKMDGVYRMWFSYRHSVDYRDGKGSYRIGYAESDDGIHFERDDAAAGIGLSETGWDSIMMCYTNVLAVDGKHYLFYNGNGFSREGIGLAEWSE